MQLKGKAFDDIFDLVGIRVLVADKSACYAALGVIHAAYTPVLGRFKDYVAMPKFNQYQSLHTTVVGPEGKSLEVQIRSHEMHLRAEKGVASHWVYKGGSTDELAWITRLAGSDADRRDPAIWLEELKSDLEPNEVFVYTPKGEVLQLPLGSTPVDFAYAVHTEVGHRCIGARINGRLVPLDHKLRSGETCEVVLRKGGNGGGPSRDWLSYVGSPRAANKIKQWFSRERRDDSLDSGREAVISGLRRENAPVHQVMATESLDRHAVAMGYADGESLLVAVGEHHVTAKAVIQRLTRDSRVAEAEAEEFVPPRTPSGRPPRPRGEIGIHVEGLDDMMVKIARCCLPVPGDEVMGFVTRGRGVSVHRSDCSNAVALGQSQPVRVIDVEWDEQASQQHFTVSVEIHAYDRPGLLRDVSGMLAEHQLNILGCSSSTDGDRISVMRFEIELADPAHLSAVLRSLKGIDGVFDAYRWVPTTHPAGVR